ncbi:MAG: ATP-dependent helicase [Candidatus Eremiobacteraeota bacterium]|nr:ATP-dependent helicase [Candidatus Eremiobacteraeota bacterium]
MRFGPDELGRGIVIPLLGEAPPDFPPAQTYDIEETELVQPDRLLAALHKHWLRRERVIIRLGVDKNHLKTPERLEIEPYQLDPRFEFSQERLHFLLWANNYDATGEEPIWWYHRLALRLGATSDDQAEVDLDGPRWCDGGPRTALPFPVLHRESIQKGSLTLTYPAAEVPAELSPSQNRAVGHCGGGARILAPAGSGKTRVLTERFRQLLDRGVEASSITAVAYNRRAAREMQSRLGDRKLSIRTIHSLGYGLLRKAWKVELASNQQIRAILKSLIQVAPQLNTDPYQPYLDAFQEVRQALRDPKEVEASRDDIPGFAEAFPRFRNKLKQRNLVDHDEQIYGAIELLLTEPEVRTRAQSFCQHMLVDEFQDLTPAFLLLIRLLSSPAYQIFGVGDDDQVIYGYAGATPDYLIDFSKYFPGASTFMLETNYRCPKGVVVAASRLLQANKRRVEKDITARQREGDPPRLSLARPEQWCAEAVRTLEEWLEIHPPNEIAVLSRVNALLLPLQIALTQKGLPHDKVVDLSILQRTGVRTALAYRRLCLNPDNLQSSDLADALRRPNRKLKREYVDKACQCRSRLDLQKYAARLEEWASSQLEEFLIDLAFLSRRLEKGEPSFFKALRTETEFAEALDQLDSVGLGAAGSSHQDDLLALEQLSHLCEEADFEVWLTENLQQPRSTEPGIRLSSVHRVKGLEWPCVLVYGVENGLFPHRLSEDEEEERRILHVAITRSKECCVMLASKNGASPFLQEMA